MAACFQPPSHLFERNISLNDLDLALDVREIVRKDVVVPEEATKHRHLGDSTKYSFVLPSLQSLEDEFRKFVFSFLVDGHILRELETARRLNWCSSLCRMVTVNTLGDGNCLMHAASIGMWAVNDRYQTLRKTVYEALVEDLEGTSFYHNRWKAEEHRQVLTQTGGFERTEQQWAYEWEEVIRLASQSQYPYGASGAQYGSLEEIHIFVLANILRRTIIVVSDETLRGHFDESYAPINFGGIYLPLLWDSIDCVKSPLVIGYADGHFTAVVSIEDGKLDLGVESGSAPTAANCIHAVPLVKFDGTPLPVHFLFDYEEPMASDRLRQYLDCAKVPMTSNSGESRSSIVVAKLHFVEQPPCMKGLIQRYFAKAREEYQRMSKSRQKRPQFQPGIQQLPPQFVCCKTQGCEFFGSTETGYRCSKCLNEYLKSVGAASQPSPHAPARQLSTGQQKGGSKANSATTSMNLPISTSRKCGTTGCKYAAVPEQGGLCERCFDAERSAEELAASINDVHLATATPCANQRNGCQFFGLPEHHNLCSRCYRAFSLQMENSLGVGSPNGLPPSSPIATAAAGFVPCQTPSCNSPGIPALYGMCFVCYTGCIHSFINSGGRLVRNSASSSARPASLPSPPPDVTNRNQVPFGAVAGKKGVLCASPGCLNEGVFQFKDLCEECYRGKSAVSLQMTNNRGPVSSMAQTAVTCSFPVMQPPPSTVTATPSVTPTYQMASGSSGHQVASALSNPSCRRFEGQVQGSSLGSSEVRSQYPLLPLDAITTACPTAPRTSQAQRALSGASKKTEPKAGQVAVASTAASATVVSTAQSTQAAKNKCAMGCGEPAVEDNGLCRICYARAFQLELNREPEPKSSRQQGATASAIPGNKVKARTASVPTSPSRTLQTTEPVATTKKAGVKNPLPCTTPGCLNFSIQGVDGLCEECLRKKGNSALLAESAPQSNNSQGFNSGFVSRPVEQNRHFDSIAAGPLHLPVQVCQTQSHLYRSEEAARFGGNVQGMKCRQENCTLFGTPEMNGYCSRCFLESTIPQSGPFSIPDFPSETSSRSEPLLREGCLVTGCPKLAAPDKHGHCEDCFKRFHEDAHNVRDSIKN
ncbi:tumor necrosis factor alpha-induced protein 3-like isoform X1 [Montipora foliosa]|uniref:tumor necrosis factor alpha-induced protein 3-like isoform X1 n=1 Tax=Montipora foliosa TaxID=591990 RepID=UPI0035F11524